MKKKFTLTVATCFAILSTTNAQTNGAGSINTNLGVGTSGTHYCFIGNYVGHNNTTGSYNSFFGDYSGNANTTGSNNTFTGYEAGGTNTAGSNNTFNGYGAGYSNGGSYYRYGGHDHTFIGYYAGYYSGSGDAEGVCIENTFVGSSSGFNNTLGASNTFNGFASGYGNTTGVNNTFIGSYAGQLYSTGTNNTFIGASADANANGLTNATAIGNGAITTANNMMYLGNANALIYCATGSFTGSDGRFKTNVQENVQGLAFIKKLRPVTYNMDTKKLDDFLTQNMPDSIKAVHQQGMDFGPSTAIVHSGFIAQEVEQAAKDINFTSSIVSAPANSNSHYALNYAEIVVPLVKAVQELSHITDSVKTVNTKQDSINTALQNQLNSQQQINAKNDSVNASLQNQLNQLLARINACCSASGTINTKSSTDSTANQISVSLTNEQTVVLSQNVPNPFAQQTTINYSLPVTVVSAQMLFYNAQGLLIQTVNLTQKGNGSIVVFGQDLSSGMYTYTLVADGQIIDTKQMIKQ